jgi:ribosome-associated protein
MAKKTLEAIVIDALEDIKGRDIKLVNVAKITSEFDRIAIASGDSTRQTKALANNVIEKVKEAGFHVVGSEGEGTGEWVLVDCGDVVVHIMQPAVREYYKLEELWQEGKLEYPKPKPAPKAKAAVEETPVKKVAAKKPAAKKPAAKKPAVKKPAAKKPAAKKPAAKKPAAKVPATKKPAAKKPATKVPTTKPVAKKPTAKKPAAKKPAAKKPAAKKPATVAKKKATSV